MKKRPKEIKIMKCVGCGKKVPRQTMVRRKSKLYCCPDCAEGRECDCQ